MRAGSWLPAASWMVAIALFSTSPFSAETTGRLVQPVLSWLLPWLSPDAAARVHVLGRKLGHLTEYAILAYLWHRAFTRDRILGPRSSVAATLGLSIGWACADEFFQSFMTGRTGAATDVAIDAAGAAAALALAGAGWRWTLDVLVGALLWIAAAGGGAALVINLAAGVPSGVLWITAPAAALVLALQWRSRRRPRRRRDGAG